MSKSVSRRRKLVASEASTIGNDGIRQLFLKSDLSGNQKAAVAEATRLFLAVETINAHIRWFKLVRAPDSGLARPFREADERAACVAISGSTAEAIKMIRAMPKTDRALLSDEVNRRVWDTVRAKKPSNAVKNSMHLRDNWWAHWSTSDRSSGDWQRFRATMERMHSSKKGIPYLIVMPPYTVANQVAVWARDASFFFFDMEGKFSLVTGVKKKGAALGLSGLPARVISLLASLAFRKLEEVDAIVGDSPN